MADETVEWLQGYSFTVYYPPSVTWNDVPGVYLFVGLNSARQRQALYVGQAASLSDRIPGHERWPEAARLGATEVHARRVDDAALRTQLERDLIQHYQPVLNVQYR